MCHSSVVEGGQHQSVANQQLQKSVNSAASISKEKKWSGHARLKVTLPVHYGAIWHHNASWYETRYVSM